MAEEVEDFLLPRFQGDEIAPFANEENKELDREVRLKRKKVGDIDENQIEVKERLQVLNDHLKNVKHEVDNTQALIAAKRKEIDSEEHMSALTDRQSGRLESEQRKLDRIIQDYLDRANALQTEIFKGNERLDQLKLEMNWNQEELEQWALAARQKEEDQLTLEKYRRADEIKVRDLVLAAEKLTMELAEKKKLLDREVTETQAAQLELDRTASYFKQLHSDRHKLMTQWKEAFDLFRSKEDNIDHLGAAYKAKETELARKKFTQTENQKMLDQINAACSEQKSSIQVTDRELAERRIHTMAFEKEVGEFKDEVYLLRNELGAVSSKLAARRDHLNQLAQDIETRKANLVKLQRTEEAAAQKLEQHKDQSLTKEQLAQEADRLLAEQQAKLEDAQREVKVTKDKLFAQNQALYKLRDSEATIMGEISGAEASKKTIMFQVHRLDQERQRQQELTYRVEYQCQMMLREVARVSGERSVDEQKELRKKIEDAKASISETQKFMKALSTQIKKLDSDIRHTQHTASQESKSEAECGLKLEELRLQCANLTREAQVVAKRRDVELVQLDKLQLEAKRLREVVSERGQAVFQKTNELEGIKLNLRERKMDIKVQVDTTKAAVRTADDERHQLVLELADRKQRVGQLSARHASLEAKNQTPGEEGGGRKSQAYHLIKASQDKEALQRKGDMLEASNQELVKVIKSLQNVLSHLIATSAAYKNYLQKGTGDGSADQQRAGKERIHMERNDELFLKNKELEALSKDVETDGSRLRDMARRSEECRSLIQSLTTERNQLERQLTLQDVEVDEAHREMIVQRQHAVNAGALEGPRSALLEMEVQAAIVREQNAELLKALSQAFQDRPEVISTVSRVFKNLNLAVPSI